MQARDVGVGMHMRASRPTKKRHGYKQDEHVGCGCVEVKGGWCNRKAWMLNMVDGCTTGECVWMNMMNAKMKMIHA